MQLILSNINKLLFNHQQIIKRHHQSLYKILFLQLKPYLRNFNRNHEGRSNMAIIAIEIYLNWEISMSVKLIKDTRPLKTEEWLQRKKENKQEAPRDRKFWITLAIQKKTAWFGTKLPEHKYFRKSSSLTNLKFLPH